MKKVKDFFEKLKNDRKFANAPPGHKLGSSESASQSTTARSSSSSSSSSVAKPLASSTLLSSSSTVSSDKHISAKAAAAEAAARRQAQQLEKNKVKLPRTYLPPPEKTPDEEMKPDEPYEEKINEDDLHKFNCPGLEIVDYYPLAELKKQIMDKIKSNFQDDLVICGSLLIRNCNPRDKADVCISTLEAILNNLTTEDEEKLEKFTKLRKIKIENKILCVKGGLEFLNGIGFTPSQDDEWFVFNGPKDSLREKIQYYFDVLSSSEAFPIKLDRQVQVYDLNNLNTPNVDFDDKVFEYSKDELAREQQIRKETAEREMALMTKAMREKYINKKPRTRYTRLRYKSLDLKMVEATFRTSETVIDLLKWMEENHSIKEIESYDIVCGTKIIPVDDWGKTFLQLDFYPKVTFYQRLRPTEPTEGK